MARDAVSERRAAGKNAREAVPRKTHAEWRPPAGRADPVGILERQAETRVAELLPIRYGRMLQSPFAFFRGAAAIMAADIAATPRSGFVTQLCGDAHLSNFGGFAGPDRELLFDLNDFDETLPGPWEWDVKRLGASLAVAGRNAGLGSRQRRVEVEAAARAYRKAMRDFAAMGNLDVWYSRLRADDILATLRGRGGKPAARDVKHRMAKARTKDRLHAFAKLTRRVDGTLALISDPPLVVPARELLPERDATALAGAIDTILRDYTASLRPDLRGVVESYQPLDVARKVVGVGSVGTRDWVVLMVGRDESDPLFLQVKEAPPSVLQAHLGRGRYANQGRRVVEGQRLMQAAGDLLLGWIRTASIDGVERDFYVRQLWDWKYSVEIEALDADQLAGYAGLCGWTLARAHARTSDRVAIAAYLGAGDSFDKALAKMAEAYADTNDSDHEALVHAVRTGRIQADTSV
ncbi:MAG TPA: DUF2252 domain-containing protein [Thermoleophilaceae bacterium]